MALFSLLLPSSVVDPLMKDFIAKHTLEMMNQNLADCLFVLSFASLQLHGPAQRGDASAAKEMRALFERVARKNRAAMALLQDGDFQRACASSFEKLYCVLYSFGTTLLSLQRVRSLVSRALGLLEKAAGVAGAASTAGVASIRECVETVWEAMAASRSW